MATWYLYSPEFGEHAVEATTQAEARETLAALLVKSVMRAEAKRMTQSDAFRGIGAVLTPDGVKHTSRLHRKYAITDSGECSACVAERQWRDRRLIAQINESLGLPADALVSSE